MLATENMNANGIKLPLAMVLLLLSTSARRWVAMTRKYNGKTMARALMFFLCSAFFIWDAFGTSLSENDLAYI